MDRLVQIRQGALLADVLAHVSPRRLLVDVQHNIHGHCFAVMQLRPSADHCVGGVSSVKMQCESKDAIYVIQFFWLVEFLCASRYQAFLLAMHAAAKRSSQRFTDVR